MQLKSGYTLSNGKCLYVIESVLGKGGFGITYKVYSIVNNNDGNCIKNYFAIKEFFVDDWCVRDAQTGQIEAANPTRDKFELGKRDFLSEAKRLSYVSHPNIVKVYDVFEENNTAYYVMEYIDGCNLDTYLNSKGALSSAQALALMRPVLDAVRELHANNMTHLDIKPANIMLKNIEAECPVAILIDFGLTKHYDAVGNPTTTLRQGGYSDGYSPVEQYGGISTFSPQSDVYALAATLFHCLVGFRPPKSTEATKDHLSILLPSSLNDNIKRSILDAMKLSKTNRTQSVKEFITALYDSDCTQQVSSTTILGNSKTKSTIVIVDNDEFYRNEKSRRLKNVLLRVLLIVAIAGMAWLGYEYMRSTPYQGSMKKGQREMQTEDNNAQQLAMERARQDSILKVRQDSLKQARQDSIERATRITPDLSIFNLRGPVKTLKIGEYETWEFTPEGKLKTIPKEGYTYECISGENGYTKEYIKGEECTIEYIRDENGYLIKVEEVQEPGDISATVYKYNKNGQLVEEEFEHCRFPKTTVYMYNQRGYVEKKYIESRAVWYVGYDTYTYTYTNIDKYGNWISRDYILNEKTGCEDETLSSEETKTGTETRQITYYE